MKKLFYFLSFAGLIMAFGTQVAWNKPIPALVYALVAIVAAKAGKDCS